MTLSSEQDTQPGQRVPLRRIFALLGPYRWRLAWLLTLLAAQASLGVIAPLFVREIIDPALPHRDTLLLSLLALGMIASSAGSESRGVATTGVRAARS